MRFSKKFVFYRLVMNILIALLIGYIAFNSFITEEGEILDIAPVIGFGAGIGYYILASVYAVLYYYCSYYEVNDNEVICRTGVLFRKKSILDYKKIHAVNIKQNIFEKMFNISTLTIDSGSTNTASRAEIKIIENHTTCLKLMDFVKAKQRGETVERENNYTLDESSINDQLTKPKQNLYEFTSKRKLMYSFLNFVGGFVVLLVISLFIISLLSFINYFSIDKINILSVIVIGLIAFAVINLITFAITVLVSFIQYHDFKLYKNGNDIDLNYGLLTRNSNTFKINKIKAVRINQGLIKRIFKFVTIKVEVIGYIQNVNNNSDQKTGACGVLIPLCKESEVDYYLNKILPNYVPSKKEAQSKYYLPFISYGSIAWISTFVLFEIIFAIPMLYYQMYEVFVACSLFVFGFFSLFYMVFIVEKVFEYKNQGVTINNDVLTLFYGGFIRETVVINKQNVIGIDKITTHFRKKKDIYSYIVHIKTNANTNTIKVNNVDINETEHIYKLLRY